MLDAFYISAIGLQAQKEQLDALANNLANIGTTAFKRQSIDFSALLDRAQPGAAGASMGTAEARPDRLLRIDMKQGEVHATGRALDVAIVGAGFFEVMLPEQKIGYSRCGSLQVGADGTLGVVSGQPLRADIRVPTGASDVLVLPDGRVTALLPGDTEATVLGQIELVTFANPELLQYQGGGVFTAATDEEAQRMRPGEDGVQPLSVQSLEGSNIQMTDEMVSLMLMQRIYELNSRVAQAADEMIGITNNLRRS
jgi:flagellar basal-body rod protein FlgG